MLILCDNFDFAAELLPPDAVHRLASGPTEDPTLHRLTHEFLEQGCSTWSGSWPNEDWRYLVLSRFSPRSQYDHMIELARKRGEAMPDRLTCIAGSGEGFRGFKGRSWSAAAGNLHLTVHLAPDRAVERFETAFTMLAALSVVDAIDGVPGLEGLARIKWVNDVLVQDAKVAGILAYTLSQPSKVSAVVLGIGLNVETAPDVHRTPFVPAVGALRDFAPDAPEASQRGMLTAVLRALHGNYRALLEDGYRPFLKRYEERSGIVGRRVAVCAEDSGPEPTVIREGTVVALGEGLELYLDDGDEPITRGRLVLAHPERGDTGAPGIDASKGRKRQG